MSRQMDPVSRHLRDIAGGADTRPAAAAYSAGEEHDAWLLSFVDMLTLIVTLFVVLLAFSRFQPGTAAATRPASPQPVAERHAGDVARPPVTAAARVDALVIPADLEHRLAITRTATSVSFEIRDSVLFDSGSADLKPDGRALLARIAEVLTNSAYPVSVEGHTDNAPIHTARFPSNWELSTSRATMVTRYLIEQGIATARLRATGFADTQPLSANDTAAGRARNRRVSLVVQLDAPVTRY